MFKIQKIQIIILFLTFCSLLSYNLVEAAELNLTSQAQEIGISQQFQVDLMLDTEGEYINAVEGKVIFPENLLELKEIRDGATIINFWIERPGVKSDNQIVFSGIIPGGYIGKKGLIFSAIFQSKNQGEGIIEIPEAKTLLNDGKGTQALLSISNLQFLISKQIPSLQIPISEIKDIDPPEPFKPEIARDPEIFNGQYFLVFATQDKASGIDHYEIQETRNKQQGKSWVGAESPYVLKDQKLRSYIYVKAVDKAGNERVAVVEPRYPLKWYENWWIWGIIIIIGFVLAYITRKILWRK